jgi:hypothetical protein
MARAKPIRCPMSGDCFNDDCTATHCLEEIAAKAAESARRTEEQGRAWLNAKDRREAGLRALREFIAEKNSEQKAAGIQLTRMPGGQEREATIDRMLASERQVERVNRHLDAIKKERAGLAPKRVRRQSRAIDIDL